jgi:hypothetical protein
MAGYVSDMLIGVEHGSVAGGEVRAVELLAGRGRLRCFMQKDPQPVAPARAGFHVTGRAHFVRFREMRFDVAGFDLHWIIRPGSPGARSLFIISCPLWFAMLVALVSPAMWLIARRRRRRRMDRDGASAFAVVQSGPPTETATG